MQNGKIIKTGGADLAKELEIKGYEWLKIKESNLKRELLDKNNT